jgi:hypothetical protein
METKPVDVNMVYRSMSWFFLAGSTGDKTSKDAWEEQLQEVRSDPDSDAGAVVEIVMRESADLESSINPHPLHQCC